MHFLYLGMGGNMGNKRSNFKKVYKLIENEIGIIQKLSSVYESEPWGFSSKNMFWNQVLLVKTNLEPMDILNRISSIELHFGRKRVEGAYQSRKIDLDLLFYDDLIMESKSLTIPHPLIPQRLFVLIPMAEIAPGFVHPHLQTDILDLLKQCPDTSKITKLPA